MKIRSKWKTVIFRLFLLALRSEITKTTLTRKCILSTFPPVKQEKQNNQLLKNDITTGLSMDKKLSAKSVAYASVISAAFTLGGIQTRLELKNNSTKCLLCARHCAGPFNTISSYKGAGRWILFLSALWLRSRDSERLTDSS